MVARRTFMEDSGGSFKTFGRGRGEDADEDEDEEESRMAWLLLSR